MIAFPQARVTDVHACTMTSPPPAPPLPVPTPMPIMPPCCPTVLVGNLPAARIGDQVTPTAPHLIIKGSSSVLIGNMPAARVTDTCLCGGPILKGQPNVLVGG